MMVLLTKTRARCFFLHRTEQGQDRGEQAGSQQKATHRGLLLASSMQRCQIKDTDVERGPNPVSTIGT